MFRWTKRWQLQLTGMGLVLAVLILTGIELYDHHVNGWEDLEIIVAGELLLFAGSLLLGILLGANMARQAGLGQPQLRLAGSLTSQAEKPRRVLVCADSLLTAGVGELLTHDQTLDIHRVVPADEAALLSEISRLQPDALVLDDNTPLTQPVSLLGRLAGCPQLRVVIINADHNSVQVFDHASVGHVAIEDLVFILRNDRELSCNEDGLLETAISNHSPQALTR